MGGAAGKAKSLKHVAKATKSKKAGKAKIHLHPKTHAKVKKVVHKLKKVLKTMVGQVVQSKKLKQDAKEVKKLKKRANKDLRRAADLEKVKDFADATAYG